MIKLSRRLSTRECVLMSVTVVVILGFFVYRQWVLPTYDQWSSLRALVQDQMIDYTRLTRNLAQKQIVDDQFNAIGDAAWQAESDLKTLSRFVRDVQALTDQYKLTMRIPRQEPIRKEQAYKVYPVRLSVSGKIMDVLQFVTDLLNRPTITGLESFDIRGIQGGNVVECRFSIWMIGLIPDVGDQKLSNSSRVSAGSISRRSPDHHQDPVPILFGS